MEAAKDAQQRLRKEGEKARHREAILAAAREVFSEKGFYFAKMEEVAARAGYSAGTIYNYFRSKEDLYVTVIDEGLMMLAGTLNRVIDGPGPFVEKFEAVVRESFEFADSSRSFSKLMIQQTAHATTELIGTFTSKGQVWYAKFIDVYAKLMFQGIREGGLRPIDPKDLAHMFLGIQHELFHEWLFSPVEYSLVGKAPFFMDFFINGAGSPDGAAGRQAG
ncbi:MAG: TetR/AcrR family transcriptional regulator [Deltaproteobacteria bacterium]|nr:TetR/AcrR family transcriptional regulator [Deltaproteobacteria bacterium]